jgi:hypothetical protein
MKTSKIVSVALLAMGFGAWAGATLADSTAASCEVRKDGETQKGKSGPCTFSQRQGYIDIDLKNGNTISLRPGKNPGHYKDQGDNKVVRTSAGDTGMSLKWENGKRINITWGGANSYGNPAHGAGGNHSAEYQRGYNDGLRGNWDQDRHTQDYKDGYRAAESAGGGKGNGGQHSGQGNYSINQLGDGRFEVVWSKPFCSVLIGRKGGISQTTEDCTDQQIERSREVGQRGY